jgi:hypothetical protein
MLVDVTSADPATFVALSIILMAPARLVARVQPAAR